MAFDSMGRDDNMNAIGVYIHYPWCRSRCPYCDFSIEITKKSIPHNEYLEAVLAEFRLRVSDYPQSHIISIYFGGGTPSLWNADCIATMIQAVLSEFDTDGDVEITLEANPRDCTEENLIRWKHAGITRLSIGTQSFDDSTLIVLGRDHDKDNAKDAVIRAMNMGCFAVSCDLIFGVPKSRYEQTIKPVLNESWLPKHLSIYELTYEDKTLFSSYVKRNVLQPLDDTLLETIYCDIHETLTAKGYEHYEISSYAYPQHRSRHNSLYWSGNNFLGVGNSAASFQRFDDGSGKRWTNIRSVKSYMKHAPDQRVALEQLLSKEEVMLDLLWLGSRTSSGTARKNWDAYCDVLTWLLSEGLGIEQNGYIHPTLRGFLYADHIASRLFLDKK